MRVETAEGYVIDLTDKYGYTSKIAMLCKGKRWFATHYETGINCTPPTKPSGEIQLRWKRDDLIVRLKDIDFKRCLQDKHGNNTFQDCIDMIEEYKRTNQWTKIQYLTHVHNATGSTKESIVNIANVKPTESG